MLSSLCCFLQYPLTMKRNKRKHRSKRFISSTVSDNNTLSSQVRGTKCDDIPRGHTCLKPCRIIKGITISPGANSLKKMPKDTRLTTLWICKLPSTAIPICLCSQTSTLTTHNPTSFLDDQGKRAAYIQVSLTSSNTTSYTPANRHHRNRHVEPINQAHIVEMQGGFRSSKCHFDKSGRGNSTESPTL